MTQKQYLLKPIDKIKKAATGVAKVHDAGFSNIAVIRSIGEVTMSSVRRSADRKLPTA